MKCARHGELNKNQRIKSGFTRHGTQGYRCKECYKVLRKGNYAKNKARIYEKTKRWRESNSINYAKNEKTILVSRNGLLDVYRVIKPGKKMPKRKES